MGGPRSGSLRSSLILTVMLACIAVGAPAASAQQQPAANASQSSPPPPANSSFTPSEEVKALQRAASGLPATKAKKKTAKKKSSPAGKSYVAPLSIGRVPVTPSVAPQPKHKHKKAKHDKPASTYSPPGTTTDMPEKPALVTRVLREVPTAVWIALLVLAALATALAAGSATSALRARRLTRQRALLRADVGLLQSALLPAVPARIGEVAVSAAYRPAGGPAAGGDFYDLFPLGTDDLAPGDDDRLAVIVGDVSGHGRGALPQTALARYTLRAYLEAGLPPREAVQIAAPGLARELKTTSLTVALGTYDPHRRTLTYSCAGHPPPIVVGIDHEAVTACSSPPVGMGLATGRRQTFVTVPRPATICFYTDGLADASLKGEAFGDARLRETLIEMGDEATAERLVEAVAAATDRHFDDMAACVLHIRGGDDSVMPLTIEEIELDATDIERRASLERFLVACGVRSAAMPSIRQRATATVRHTGAALVRVTRGAGEPTVEVGPPQVRVLDPLRAAGA